MMSFLYLFAAGLFLNSAMSPEEVSAEPSPPCSLTEADKVANARLSFDEFDQQSTTPVTFRALSDRGCYSEAAEAMESYLLDGPDRSGGQQRINLFHMAQALAFQGAEREAARLVAATRSPTRSVAAGELDWNSYIEGVWAFLVKARPRLDEAHAALAGQAGDGNRINASVLGRLQTCFDRSYTFAMTDQSCVAGQ